MTKETGIKPVFFLKGKRLFVRYTVDRAVELSTAEESKLKVDMSMNPAQKQQILGREWNLQTVMNEKPVIMDGIKAAEERMCELSSRFGGRKNG